MDQKAKESFPLKVLLLEDSPQDAEIIRESLIEAGFDLSIDWVSAEKEFVSLLRSRKYDIILADFNMPGFDGFEALRYCSDICPKVPYICVSGTVGEETAVELIRRGAVDYILKDRPNRLPSAIKRALDEAQEKEARKQAEKELRKLSTAVEQSPTSIVITDTEGNIEYVNPKFLEVTGYVLNEVISKKSRILKSGEQPDSYYKTLWTTISSGETWTGEFHNKKKNGELFWESASISPILDDSGNITQYIAIKEDITDRKLAETEIVESLLSAKQANNVKDQFIANISHEIRTPLNSIIGFSDLFRQRYGDLVNKQDRDIFQYITNSSNRLMRTVDSILNISQLNAGVIKIEKRELDLNYLVRAVIGEIKPLADEKGLDLTYSPSDEFAMVNVDNYSIHQAILNITENAIKYTNEGKIELKLIQEGDRFRFSIQDTGIGISEEYQKRIFTPYTQESEGFTKNYQGIGLGLALTKRYLELNNIDLELESKKNVGTTFTLIFPKSDGSDHV